MLSLTLPIQTVSEANMREHWARKHKRTKMQRWACNMQVSQALPKRWSFPVGITLTRIGPRPLDGDNLQGAFKGCRDGVADALGLKSDADPRVTWEYAQKKGEPKQYAIRIDIFEVERE